jgi:hypothetical protein
MKNRLQKTILTVAVCLLSASASAVVVDLRETGLGNGMGSGGLILPVTSGSQSYWAGLQKLTLNNSQSLLAFCVDPWEWSSGDNHSYSTNNLNTIFGQAKADFVRELYSEAYAGTLLTTSQGNLNAAAFQLALWEIITDDNPGIAGLQFNLDSGLVRKVSTTDSSLVAATNTLLSKIDGVYGSENYAFSLYVSGKSMGQGTTGGFQDFLVANRIPEPGAFSLMLGALGGMGLLGWRRRQLARKA